jgi:hypothetical protein
MMAAKNEIEEEVMLVTNEVLLAGDIDEAKERVRGLVKFVAERAVKHAVALKTSGEELREWMSENHEDLLCEPALMEKVQKREQVLMRANPNMPNRQRWDQAVRDVRKRWDVNSYTISAIRQGRPHARHSGDAESYSFDTGSGDDFDDAVGADEAELQADRTAAIAGLHFGRQPRKVQVDKARYNEQELRRRQRNDR